MARNNQLFRQTILDRVQNALVKCFAFIGVFFTLRTLYDGGNIFEVFKFYTFDFIVNIITIITHGS